MHSAIPERTQPPLSNKGGNTLNKLTIPESPAVAINLDWLRYSRKYDTTISEADNLRLTLPRFPEFYLTGEEISNGRGYNRAQQCSIGVIHWHTQNPKQGVSFEMSGSALAEARNAKIAEMEILAHIAAVHAKVSTLDSAIDIYNHAANPHQVIELRDAGKLRTNVRHIGNHVSSDKREGKWREGETVYIGSPTSERQIKIYNKAAQMGKDADWIRVEMRWRGPYARAAHAAMLRFGIPETTKSAIMAMVDFDAGWWRVAMDGDLADIEPVGRKDTNTLAWLMGPVLRTLERELASERMNGERKLFDAFYDVLRESGQIARVK